MAYTSFSLPTIQACVLTCGAQQLRPARAWMSGPAPEAVTSNGTLSATAAIFTNWRHKSTPGLRLDVYGGGASSPGTQIDVWTATGGSNQKWALTKVN